MIVRCNDNSIFPSNNNIDFQGQSGADWVPQQSSSSFHINPLHGKIKNLNNKMFTLLSTSAYTVIHEWKTAAVKKLKMQGTILLL